MLLFGLHGHEVHIEASYRPQIASASFLSRLRELPAPVDRSMLVHLVYLNSLLRNVQPAARKLHATPLLRD